MRRNLLIGAVALAAACLAFGTAPALAQGGGAMKDKAKDAAKAAANPDQKFVMDAAQGGMMEVQLGTLATQKAASDDVKQFGQRMVDDHSKANQELTTLAGQNNIAVATALDAKNQAMVDKLSKLSGAEFDKEYMAHMVSDHEKDVAEFERESKSGKDAEVKSWAGTTLPTLQEHLRMAKEVHAKVAGGAAHKMK